MLENVVERSEFVYTREQRYTKVIYYYYYYPCSQNSVYSEMTWRDVSQRGWPHGKIQELITWLYVKSQELIIWRHVKIQQLIADGTVK